jgi:hypothetical protein
MLDYEFFLFKTDIQVINQARLIDTENASFLSDGYSTTKYSQMFNRDSSYGYWDYFYTFEDPSTDYELAEGI